MIVVIWIVCGKLFHFHFVYVGVLEEVLRGCGYEVKGIQGRGMGCRYGVRGIG